MIPPVSPSGAATAVLGSIGAGMTRWFTRRARSTTSASSILAESPVQGASTATLPPCSGNSSGAPGSSAATGSVTTGSGSYSTETSSAAWSACSRVAATTTATASPRKRTTSRASCGRAMTGGPIPGGRGGRSRSAAVSTATTPGMPAAWLVSSPPMRACATTERTKTACSAPGIARSSVYRAEPVTMGGSSTRRTASPRLVSISASYCKAGIIRQARPPGPATRPARSRRSRVGGRPGSRVGGRPATPSPGGGRADAPAQGDAGAVRMDTLEPHLVDQALHQPQAPPADRRALRLGAVVVPPPRRALRRAAVHHRHLCPAAAHTDGDLHSITPAGAVQHRVGGGLVERQHQVVQVVVGHAAGQPGAHRAAKVGKAGGGSGELDLQSGPPSAMSGRFVPAYYPPPGGG